MSKCPEGILCFEKRRNTPANNVLFKLRSGLETIYPGRFRPVKQRLYGILD